MNVIAIVIGFLAVMTVDGRWPGAAAPDAADSFGGLAQLIELGEDITVAYEPDGEITGLAHGVSESSLTLMVDGSPFELDGARILRVRQHWDDPTWDGSLIGFGFGFSPMMVVSILHWVNDGAPTGAEFTGQMLGTTAFGLIGALIGSTVDRNQTRLRDLYIRPRPRVSFSPTAARDRLGVVATVEW